MSGLKYLQGWIGVIGFTAFGNTVSCFLDFSFLSERIYTEVPNEGGHRHLSVLCGFRIAFQLESVNQ